METSGILQAWRWKVAGKAIAGSRLCRGATFFVFHVKKSWKTVKTWPSGDAAHGTAADTVEGEELPDGSEGNTLGRGQRHAE